MAKPEPNAGQPSGPDASESRIRAWIEDNVGPVRALAREGRWRPAWFAEADTSEGLKRLYIRGARGGRWPPRPLAYEARAHRVLEQEGLRVPRLYGYIPDVPALVMERVPGRPNLSTAETEQARSRIREQLADQMRLMHGLDVRLIADAGAPMPETPEDTTLSAYREVERIYLDGDRPPSPDIEFVRRWIDRNVPPCREAPAVIAMDAGQFIFEGDELTALLDFEFLCIGDRHVDFAALRTRERIEGFDDPEAFYRLYEARGGLPVDIDRVRFQHIAFSLFTPLEIAHDRAHPKEAADYHEYLIWHVISIKDALEGIAEATGVQLDAYVPPEPQDTSYRPSLEALIATVGAIDTQGELDAYRAEKARLALEYLLRAEAWRSTFEQAYLADIRQVTGIGASSEMEGSARLEAFVRQAGPERDEALLRLLHHQIQRQASILSDTGTWLHQSLTTPLRPLKR